MFLFLICCIAAVIAPKELTPMFVPIDSGMLRPVDKINGSLITPRTKLMKLIGLEKERNPFNFY
jgi:hypothetical protein